MWTADAYNVSRKVKSSKFKTQTFKCQFGCKSVTAQTGRAAWKASINRQMEGVGREARSTKAQRPTASIAVAAPGCGSRCEIAESTQGWPGWLALAGGRRRMGHCAAKMQPSRGCLNRGPATVGGTSATDGGGTAAAPECQRAREAAPGAASPPSPLDIHAVLHGTSRKLAHDWRRQRRDRIE
eukprot:349644-Chlamydomonas_euryale.AAC.1